MENEIVQPEAQNTPEGTTPNVEMVSVSKEKLDDLEFRASQSSQNWERLKQAETKLKELEGNNVLLELNSEPGNEEAIGKLKGDIAELKQKVAKAELINSNPVLGESWPDFEKFLNEPENIGMNIKTAAKVFMVEKGLLDTQRKGLEKTTGGTKTPPTFGMTVEEAKRLRETDFRKYSDMVRKGQINL